MSKLNLNKFKDIVEIVADVKLDDGDDDAQLLEQKLAKKKTFKNNNFKRKCTTKQKTPDDIKWQ